MTTVIGIDLYNRKTRKQERYDVLDVSDRLRIPQVGDVNRIESVPPTGSLVYDRVSQGMFVSNGHVFVSSGAGRSQVETSGGVPVGPGENQANVGQAILEGVTSIQVPVDLTETLSPPPLTRCTTLQIGAADYTMQDIQLEIQAGVHLTLIGRSPSSSTLVLRRTAASLGPFLIGRGRVTLRNLTILLDHDLDHEPVVQTGLERVEFDRCTILWIGSDTPRRALITNDAAGGGEFDSTLVMTDCHLNCRTGVLGQIKSRFPSRIERVTFTGAPQFGDNPGYLTWQSSNSTYSDLTFHLEERVDIGLGGEGSTLLRIQADHHLLSGPGPRSTVQSCTFSTDGGFCPPESQVISSTITGLTPGSIPTPTGTRFEGCLFRGVVGPILPWGEVFYRSCRFEGEGEMVMVASSSSPSWTDCTFCSPVRFRSRGESSYQLQTCRFESICTLEDGRHRFSGCTFHLVQITGTQAHHRFLSSDFEGSLTLLESAIGTTLSLCHFRQPVQIRAGAQRHRFDSCRFESEVQIDSSASHISLSFSELEKGLDAGSSACLTVIGCHLGRNVSANGVESHLEYNSGFESHLS